MRPEPEELAKIPLFASLGRAELERVSLWLEVRPVSAGTVLVGEGAGGYSFFVLRDGSATVTQGDEQLRTLHAGDFFGEAALLGDGRRSATVTASTPSTLFVLFGTEFRQLEQELSEVAAEITRTMTERLGSAASY